MRIPPLFYAPGKETRPVLPSGPGQELRETFDAPALSRPAEHVLQVMLTRPEAAIAFNTLMGCEVLDLFADLAAEPDYCRAIVLTGAGDRASVPAATSK